MHTSSPNWSPFVFLRIPAINPVLRRPLRKCAPSVRQVTLSHRYPLWNWCYVYRIWLTASLLTPSSTFSSSVALRRIKMNALRVQCISLKLSLALWFAIEKSDLRRLLCLDVKSTSAKTKSTEISEGHSKLNEAAVYSSLLMWSVVKITQNPFSSSFTTPLREWWRNTVAVLQSYLVNIHRTAVKLLNYWHCSVNEVNF